MLHAIPCGVFTQEDHVYLGIACHDQYPLLYITLIHPLAFRNTVIFRILKLIESLDSEMMQRAGKSTINALVCKQQHLQSGLDWKTTGSVAQQVSSDVLQETVPAVK